METITIVGAGVAGLTAAITLRRGRRAGRALRRARRAGRPRAQPGRAVQGEPRPARALQGRPAVGAGCASADLLPPPRRHPAHRVCGCAGTARSTARRRSRSIPSMLRLRGRRAPVDETFRAWAPSHADDAHRRAAVRARRRLHLPPRPGRAVGRVRVGAHVRALLTPPPVGALRASAAGARWSTRSRRARAQLGVTVAARRARRPSCPATPAIVAVEPADAARAARRRRRCTWLERPHRLRRPRARATAAATRSSSPTSTSAAGSSATRRADPSLAPAGEELVQAQMPVRPGESADAATARLERCSTSRSPTGASARPGAAGW